MTQETGEKRSREVYLPPKGVKAHAQGGTVSDMPYNTMWKWDFYGSPAWTFWVGCIALGAIVGIIIHG